METIHRNVGLIDEKTVKRWRLIDYVSQLTTLKKKQTGNPEPTDVKELVKNYIVPLENIVHHFEALFLVESKDENENDTTIVTNLDTKVASCMD